MKALIDRQLAIDSIMAAGKIGKLTCCDILRKMPSAQPEIIRCKDCEDYQTDWETSAGLHYCSIIDTDMPPEGFCSHAERRTDG